MGINVAKIDVCRNRIDLAASSIYLQDEIERQLVNGGANSVCASSIGRAMSFDDVEPMRRLEVIVGN